MELISAYVASGILFKSILKIGGSCNNYLIVQVKGRENLLFSFPILALCKSQKFSLTFQTCSARPFAPPG